MNRQFLYFLLFLALLTNLPGQQNADIYDPDTPSVTPLWHRMADFSPRLRSVESCELSPDGRLAVSGGKFGYGVLLWRVADGTLLWENYHESEVECVVFSPDGQRIATGGEDYFMRIWDVATGAELYALELADAGFDGITWSPDGRTIVGGSESGELLFFDATTYRLRGRLHCGSTVNSVEYTRDGKRLVVGGNYQTPMVDGTTRYSGFVKIVDAEQRVVIMDSGELEGSVKSVRWSPDETMVAAGGFDKLARLFRAADLSVLRVFPGPHKIEAVAFSPEGYFLLTGGHDLAITFYRLRDAQPVLRLPSPRVEYLDFSPDGRLLLTGHEDSGLLSCYLFLSNTQARGNYQEIADQQLDNRDLNPKKRN